MSLIMLVDVNCGKCGEKIKSMNMVRPLKDVLVQGKCPSCGQTLSVSEFTLDVKKNDNDQK